MKELSLYVHIPFCKKKCLYCDFPSYSGKDKLMNDYIEALNKEIINKASIYKIKSLFIGGGTPSYLDNENLGKLLRTISKLNFTQNAEMTIECNPGTVDKEKLETMKKYNINRLSFGLQSTNDKALKNIGRIHTFQDFKENYLLSRKIGFKNINIDIMSGLPDLDEKESLQDIKNVVELNPEHISLYSLIIEEGTAFYKLYTEGKLNIPEEEVEIDTYRRCKEFLKKAGYNQYEISNYAKDNFECKHNITYWNTEEYIGVGVSASSFIGKKRLRNIDDIKGYIKKINRCEKSYIVESENTLEDNMEEFMFMGLRMINGISEDDFKNRFEIHIEEIYNEVLKKNINNNLLIRREGRIFLTEKGIELSNQVMSDMILTI